MTNELGSAAPNSKFGGTPRKPARKAAVALHFMHYNFARVHQTLRVTPAMEAGVSDRVWSLEEIIDLLK
jgi:hypothetical protein